jgi:hypothetical protein
VNTTSHDASRTTKLLMVKNQPYLWGFILVNAAAMMWTYLGLELDLSQLMVVGGKKSGAAALAGLACPVVVGVLNAVLSSSQKATLIYWRRKDALPGHRAFSELGPNDPRVNMKALEAKLGTLPVLPREQNVAWYALLRKHEPVTPLIAEDHRLFLLMRDLATIEFLFLLCAIVALPLAITPSPALVYAGVCASLYLVLRLPAVHHGQALVTDVLALEATGNVPAQRRNKGKPTSAVVTSATTSHKPRVRRTRRGPPRQ